RLRVGAFVVGDVASQIWQERRLLGDAALVDDRLRGRDMRGGRALVAVARCDARLRVLPPEVPEVALRLLEVGRLQSGLVALSVPCLGRIDIAGLEADARELVGDFASAGEVAGRHVAIVELTLVRDGT